jgi:hypothetical protein
VHRLVPRHRRKAGSGPPANALIAWIGTDTYLRDAAATASYRRWTALPMPSNTRSAGAAVVTCFALACTAVLGITAIISHGRATAQYKIATPSLFGRGGALTPSPKASLALPAEGSGVSPTPADIAPMLAERGGPQSITVPPVAKNVDQMASDHLSSPQGNVTLNATPAPVPPISSRHIDKPSNSGKPVDQVETVAVGEPSSSSKPGDTDTHTLLADSKAGGPDAPANSGTSQSEKSANPAVAGNQDASDDPAHQSDPAALTVPGAHRSRNETIGPTPTGRIDGDAQSASGDPGASQVPLSPRRSTPSLGSGSPPTPDGSASVGGSTTGHSPIAGQGSAPIRKPTSSQSSRSSGG